MIWHDNINPGGKLSGHATALSAEKRQKMTIHVGQTGFGRSLHKKEQLHRQYSSLHQFRKRRRHWPEEPPGEKKNYSGSGG